MKDDKINKAIEYYNIRINEVVNFMNSNNNLTADQIIYNGEQLSILENKMTALEVANEN